MQKENKTYQKSENWADGLFLQFEIIRQNSSLSNIEIVNELLKILAAKIFFDASIKYSETDFYQLFENIKTDNIGFFQTHEQINLQSNFLKNVLNEIHFFDKKFDFEITGKGFEFFIEKVFKNNLGQFYTPSSLIKYMVKIIDPKDSETIYDPCCGTGSFLINSYQHIQEKTANVSINDLKIQGNDISNFMVRVTQLNMKLHGFLSKNISRKDSLKTLEDSEINGFDVVFANPPFGNIKEKNHEFEVSKSTSRVEMYYLEKCLKVLKPGGRMAIVLPTFTLGAENLNIVREYIESEAKIVNITGLPNEIFFKIGAAGISSSILFLRKFTIEEKINYEQTKQKIILNSKNKSTPFNNLEFKKVFDYQVFVTVLNVEGNSFDINFDKKFDVIINEFQKFEQQKNPWLKEIENKKYISKSKRQLTAVAEPKGIYE